jgi:hypothetical protein
MRGFRRRAAVIPLERCSPGRRQCGVFVAAAMLAGFSVSMSPAQDVWIMSGPQCACSCTTSPAATANRSTSALRTYTTLRPVAELDLDGDLVVEIHEGLLNRIVRRTDQRQSEVRDFVLGADVHGTETTNTSVHIDLRPSNEGVALDLVLNGRNRSHTVGYTPQAAIRTLGQHSFVATKRIIHEGRLFRTERPQVDVTPYNQTVGAETPVSGVPFLGDVASSIAVQAAESQRSQGEAIAAQKIRDGVGTQFNQQIDEQLAKLNRGWLETIAPQLKQSGFGEIGIRAQSTDEWARYAVQLRRAAVNKPVPQRSVRPTPAGQVTTRRIATSADASDVDPSVMGRIVIRESLARSLVDQLGLAGMTVKASDFSQQVTTAMTVVEVLQQYGLEFDEVPPEALAALQSLEIKVADRSPARVLFADDEITVQVRAALAVPPLIDLPMMQIDLRYRIDGAGDDQIALVPAGVLFRPVSDDAPALGPLAPLVESQASAALPAIRLPRTVRVPIPDGTPLELSVDELEARDGTLSLTVR